MRPTSTVTQEAAKRGIRLVIAPVSYTKRQVDEAAKKALNPANVAALGGFKVTMVAGPTLATPELVVTGYYPNKINQSFARGANDIESLNRSLVKFLGVPAKVVWGGEPRTFSRATDTAPFTLVVKC